MDNFAKIKEKIQKSLLKKAFGYRYNETILEYSIDENGENLTKKKVTTKDVPPDITAVKLLLDTFNVATPKDLSSLSDEELKKEIEDAMKILDLQIKGEKNGD